MKQVLLHFAALSILVSSSLAHAVEAQKLKVSQPGDLEKTCSELLFEAFRMRDIVYATEEIKNDTEIKSHGIAAAGALGSFVIGTATGGIGLAAIGFALDRETDQEGEKADHIQDIAEQRRTLMMGIFNAKECHGPIEKAMKNPKQNNLIDFNAITPSGGQAQTAGNVPDGTPYNP